MHPRKDITFEPLTPSRFTDFERLFTDTRGELPSDENLAGGGCWCMEFRCSIDAYRRGQGEPNRLALKAIVDAGNVPGLLAYRHGQAIGWCGLGRRGELVGLADRPLLAPIDDEDVWALVCFYVAHQARREGLMGLLIEAALTYARSCGATIVEAYPRKLAGIGQLATGFQGSVETLRRAGFETVARRERQQRIMRFRFPSANDASSSH